MTANKPEVILVTGASVGVGRARAREFGKHGARVRLLIVDCSLGASASMYAKGE